jgi:hypothetical protein
MRYDSRYSHHYLMHFGRDYTYLALPKIQLQKGEKGIIEAPAKCMNAEGGLVLTDRRLVFYFFDIVREQVKGFKIALDTPLSSLTEIYWKGSIPVAILVVTTSTPSMGNRKTNEFLIMRPDLWVVLVAGLRVNENHKALLEEFKKETPVKTQAAGTGFSKICLGCMKAVPEDTRVCPKCGTRF